uniref:Uncharacterized protein n=1 Tax=Ralstonia solanacearum CFBP2957 TaxID=859656 RepID=D8P2C4_RALSL|nr:protein of unknown function [Ralstonia solanacearum CFBP2957]
MVPTPHFAMKTPMRRFALGYGQNRETADRLFRQPNPKFGKLALNFLHCTVAVSFAPKHVRHQSIMQFPISKNIDNLLLAFGQSDRRHIQSQQSWTSMLKLIAA